ncbi:MAG: hypothetical protein KDD53_05725 [Bdellovibrionales bacterium]|nr:hypothetical protein [Bdellovibrionales bacterium]
MSQQDFDRSLIAGSKAIAGFLGQSLTPGLDIDIYQRALACKETLTGLGKSKTIFRSDGRGTREEFISTFYQASDLSELLGNRQLAVLARSAATQALLTSVYLNLQLLNQRGNDDAWVLVEHFRSFPSDPVEGSSAYLAKVSDCLRSSNDDYNIFLAEALTTYTLF